MTYTNKLCGRYRYMFLKIQIVYTVACSYQKVNLLRTFKWNMHFIALTSAQRKRATSNVPLTFVTWLLGGQHLLTG